MNKEQREYTVTKIEKNNEEIKSLNTSATKNAFVLGLTGLATALQILVLHEYPSFFKADMVENLFRIIDLLIAGALTSGLISSLKHMIENLQKKAGIENFNDQLQHNLEIDDLSNEFGGKTK